MSKRPRRDRYKISVPRNAWIPSARQMDAWMYHSFKDNDGNVYYKYKRKLVDEVIAENVEALMSMQPPCSIFYWVRMPPVSQIQAWPVQHSRVHVKNMGDYPIRDTEFDFLVLEADYRFSETTGYVILLAKVIARRERK